jgi:hypothetical protein
MTCVTTFFLLFLSSAVSFFSVTYSKSLWIHTNFLTVETSHGNVIMDPRQTRITRINRGY